MSHSRALSAGRWRGLSLCMLAALTACGGGGGADGEANAVPLQEAAEGAPGGELAAEPAPAPAPAQPSPSAAGTRATCALPDFEFEVMALLNAHRAAGAQCADRGAFAAVPALAWNAPLSIASLAHSDDMVSNNFFSHTGSDGSSAGQRASAAGYLWSTWGENIAAGQDSVASVVAAWMGSPGHCANIMSGNFRDVGLACVDGVAGNSYRSYWTMTLGRAP